MTLTELDVDSPTRHKLLTEYLLDRIQLDLGLDVLA